MKIPFFKPLLVAGALVIAWNCSDEAAITVPTTPQGAEQFAAVTTPSWIFNGDQTYIITPTEAGFFVADKAGNPVGTYDPALGIVYDGALTPIATIPDLSQLPVLTPDQTIINPDGTITDLAGNPIVQPVDPVPGGEVVEDPNPVTPDPVITSSDTPVIPESSATVNPEQPKPTSSATPEQPKSSSSAKQEQPKSSETPANTNCDGQCLDAPSGTCVAYYQSLKGPHQEQYAYDKTCNINCYYDPNNKNCQDMGAGTAQPSSSTTQPKSSSSAKSSSSNAPASSATPSGGNDAEASKYIDAGNGGSDGWATRYWDCCMPSCGWNENAGGNPTKTCDAKGKNPIGNGSGSICSGGQGTTCTSQVPIIASDKVAYAFAAVPAADGGKCGKCFALTFTGEGKYESVSNHKALKGKTLVVMASNIGGDVSHGQFDVMIPGGGFGAFNGCGQMGWGDMSNSERYGGLLSDCEKEVGYAAGDKRKECLTKKCNNIFANDTQAKEGCLFLATWMEAAGNPMHKFKEVECPQALKGKW